MSIFDAAYGGSGSTVVQAKMLNDGSMPGRTAGGMSGEEGERIAMEEQFSRGLETVGRKQSSLAMSTFYLRR